MTIKSPKVFIYDPNKDPKEQFERMYRQLREDIVDLGNSFDNSRTKITPEGGLAVKLIAAADFSKGDIVESDNTSLLTVKLAAANQNDPLGPVYNDSVTSGQEVWVVVSGVAYCSFGVNESVAIGEICYLGTTDGILAHTSAATIGSTQHWREVGHCLEAVTGEAGVTTLARILLHFN